MSEETPTQEAWNKIFTDTCPEITPEENWIRYMRGDYDTLDGVRKDPRLYVRMVWYGWHYSIQGHKGVRTNIAGAACLGEGSDDWREDLLECMKQIGYIKA